MFDLVVFASVVGVGSIGAKTSIILFLNKGSCGSGAPVDHKVVPAKTLNDVFDSGLALDRRLSGTCTLVIG